MSEGEIIMNWNYIGRYGNQRHGTLSLVWQLTGDSFSDDYLPEDIDAVSLLRRWVERYYPDETSERMYGPGMVRISWWLRGSDGTGIERAPFSPDTYGEPDREDFLGFYSWPEDDQGRWCNFYTLPVEDRLWRRGRADKGGFVQEATGWKPSPMQPCVYIPGLLWAAGLDWVADRRRNVLEVCSPRWAS
jgi:hypothetical protein